MKGCTGPCRKALYSEDHRHKRAPLDLGLCNHDAVRMRQQPGQQSMAFNESGELSPALLSTDLRLVVTQEISNASPIGY